MEPLEVQREALERAAAAIAQGAAPHQIAKALDGATGHQAVENVEKYLKPKGKFLATKAPMPFHSGYRPEIDISGELDEADSAYFLSLVGILCWIIELGRIDIINACFMYGSTLNRTLRTSLSYLCLPENETQFGNGFQRE